MNDMSSQGFRMTVGSPTSKGSQSNPGLRYTCLQDVMTRFPETADFPTKPCPAGIMAIHHFPACWDGKNLDSPNHIDHVAHPVDGPASFTAMSGKCPASHPVKIPQVHLEIVWDTTKFNRKEDWPEDGSQPFVLSNGDTTGYGQHGDYVFGWEGDSLQKAMDNACFATNCGQLKSQNFQQANQCVVKTAVKENNDGWLKSLPGMEGMPMK